MTLCGSLRAHSSNRAILRAYEKLAPPWMAFVHYERVGNLPHFNPDLDSNPVPEEVLLFREMINAADVVVISTPEYAHALPGSFKNALDWLVSSPVFYEKPMILLHADRGSKLAQDSLREVLRTMSARTIETASVALPLKTNKLDENEVLDDAGLKAMLEESLKAAALLVFEQDNQECKEPFQ